MILLCIGIFQASSYTIRRENKILYICSIMSFGYSPEGNHICILKIVNSQGIYFVGGCTALASSYKEPNKSKTGVQKHFIFLENWASRNKNH